MVRVADGRRQFRPGEIIPIELEFDSRIPKRFVVDGRTYDRSGRLTIDEFRVEPNDAVADPLLDYFAAHSGYIGGGLGSEGVLGDKPVTVKLNLNDWFRFDNAGTYTLSVRSARVTDETQAPTTRRAPVPVDSNTVSFEILPRDPEWEAIEFDAATQIILDSGTTDLDARKGCRMLRFLATDNAVDELIKRYDEGGSGCGFESMAGLFTAPNRDRVVRQLEAGLRAAEQPISQEYLGTLAVLSVYADHPELRPAQTRETKGRFIAPGELSRRQDLVHAAEAKYAEVLDDALPEKTAGARARILSWRLESAQGRQPTALLGTAAPVDRLRDQVAAAFLDLPAERQVGLLEYQWSSLAGPAMLPILRGLAGTFAPGSPSIGDLALRRLYELAPEEGRPLILREVRNPSRGASMKTLGLLPDRALPELDELLAASLEKSGGLDAVAIRAELLQRYASKAVSARVFAQVGDRLATMACRPKTAILAYFVRVDEDLGKTLLDQALTSRATTGCYKFALRDVAKAHMSPAVEALAIDYLQDDDPQVVISAVETLGQYGSGASRQPLHTQFARWHRAWEGRQEELRYSPIRDHPDAMQGGVEVAFLQSLGRGQAWLSDKRDLGDLRALCVTDQCRIQADLLINSADDTRISILRVDRDDALVMLAQYQLTSIAALEQKLAQYPGGTSFALDVRALDPDTARAIVSDLTTVARAQGITIRR
jgi:hypothetical protein